MATIGSSSDTKTADGTVPSRDKAAGEESTLWNSLEIAKLVVSSLTAISVAGLGVLVTYESQREREDSERVARIDATVFARQAQVAAQRSELWRELGARLSRIHLSFNSEFEFPNRPDPDVVRREIRESEALLSVYEIYFSGAFNETVRNYLRQADEGLRMIDEGSIDNENYENLRTTYGWVLSAARNSIGGDESNIFRPPTPHRAPSATMPEVPTRR